MKILYLKGYKWLLSQNQRVRNDSFSHRRCETLAKHIKRFLKKVKGCQWLDYRLWKWIHMFKCMLMTFTLSVTPIWTMKENKDIKVISDLLSNIILRKLRLRQKKKGCMHLFEIREKTTSVKLFLFSIVSIIILNFVWLVKRHDGYMELTYTR